MLKVGDKVELKTKDAYYAVCWITSIGLTTLGIMYKKCKPGETVEEIRELVIRKEIESLRVFRG